MEALIANSVPQGFQITDFEVIIDLMIPSATEPINLRSVLEKLNIEEAKISSHYFHTNKKRFERKHI